MPRPAPNVPKACDPCRAGKARCNGLDPCQRCIDRGITSRCTYRSRPRIKKKNDARNHAAATPGHDDKSRREKAPETVEQDDYARKLYHHSVTAAAHGNAPDDMLSTRLWYGPSSTFAFMQQVYRILSMFSPRDRGERGETNSRGAACAESEKDDSATKDTTSGGGGNGSTIQEIGPGLDLFNHRPIFFGLPGTDPKVATTPSFTSWRLRDRLSWDQVASLLDDFNDKCRFQIPFYSETELYDLVSTVYGPGAARGDIENESDVMEEQGQSGGEEEEEQEEENDDAANSEQRGGGEEAVNPQIRATVFAVLANAALGMPASSDLAESLFHRAKHEAALCDEVVSLTMIYVVLLLASYQNAIGRPNSGYLHLGVASKKASAMGLNHEMAGPSMVPAVGGGLQKRRVIAWSVYYLETMQALCFGRDSSQKRSRITTPYPDKQPTLLAFCKLAQISEEVAASIYSQPCSSLWQLYQVADGLHSKLQACAREYGIGFAAGPHRTRELGQEALQLHNAYIIVLSLVFRPFLIAEFALHLKGSGQGKPELLWLRHACRVATDAAQDALSFIEACYQVSEPCRRYGFNGFYIETFSLILFYDTLRNPTKSAFNTQYTDKGLRCLKKMAFSEEPIVFTDQVVCQIGRLVRDHVTRNQEDPAVVLAKLNPAHACAQPREDQTTTAHSSKDTEDVDMDDSQPPQLPATQQGERSSQPNPPSIITQEPPPPPPPPPPQSSALQPTVGINSNLNPSPSSIQPPSLPNPLPATVPQWPTAAAHQPYLGTPTPIIPSYSSSSSFGGVGSGNGWYPQPQHQHQQQQQQPPPNPQPGIPSSYAGAHVLGGNNADQILGEAAGTIHSYDLLTADLFDFFPTNGIFSPSSGGGGG